MLLLVCSCVAKDINFYVSPQGNDVWTGQKSGPSAKEANGPFATVNKALAAAHAERGKNPEASITIFLRDGIYELAEPLVLRPDDSGASAKSSLILAAYKKEKPVLSTGRAIRNWKRAEGQPNLWSAELPEVKAGKWFFRQLWVDGDRRQRARHPNRGYFTIASLPDSTSSWEQGHYRFQFQHEDLELWGSANDGEVIAMTRWVESRMPITNIDARQKIVASNKKSVFQLQPGDPYYVEHVFEVLDQRGEWFLDRKQGLLFYWPMPGEKLEGFAAYAPKFAECVRLEGKPEAGQFVQHVQFRGLTFAHTEWFFPQNFGSDERHISSTPDPEIYGFAQAAFGVPGCVRAEGARDCIFDRCQFANLGGYGLQLGRGCRSNVVLHSDFFDLGAGGIKIGETQIRSTASEQAGDNTISDCDIRDGGKLFASGEGIWIGQSYGNRLAHNSIHDFYYTGISIGWTWGYGASLASNNIVEFNHVHHIGEKVNGDGPILSDMGGIYTLGAQPGTIIRNNLWHDIYGRNYGGWGIYFDEGSTGILAENNIAYGTTHGGFHQHYGKENIVRNNIFAFARDHQLQRTRAENHRSFTFEQNIVYFDHGKLLEGDWAGGQVQLDRNVYLDARLSAVTNAPTFGALTFTDWQKRGQDTNSVIADPQFEDASKFDFRLKKTSPALKLGFKPIDLRDVGPRRK